MVKTGILRSPYLLAGGAGAIVGFTFNATMSRNLPVEYANSLLADVITDEVVLKVLKRITPSVYGLAVALLLLGAARRFRAHLLRAILAYDGWFLNRGKNANKKLNMLWAVSLRVLLGKEERPIGGYQDFMPKYRLPKLNDSLDMYLESVKVIMDEDEFKEVAASVADFRKKDGPRLNRYLRYRHFVDRNWVADWWLEYVYLRCRGPIAIYSNYYTIDSVVSLTHRQIDRAAARIVTHIEVMLGQAGENQVSQGIVPFDSHYHQFMSGCARIPGVECDTIKKTDSPRHVVIIRCGKYFRLDVVDQRGRVVSQRQIKERLEYILKLVGQENDERYIAALTAQNRTTWAEQRAILEDKPLNKETFEAIDSAFFVVSLEASNPADQQDFCRRTFHGSGKNVWYDKCFTMLIFPNAYYSNNVEHTALDATVFEHLLEAAVVREEYTEDGFIVDKGEPDLELDMPQQLLWDFEGHEDFLEEAREFHFKQVENSDLCVFHGYGKSVPKACKFSPDGWVQMAIQITWYRLHKCFVSTYEAATTRMFYKGRTETIRPVSEHSCAFARAFDNPNVTMEEKRALLTKSIQYQEKYKFLAMRGYACDRHLFGLYLMAKYTKMDPFPAFLQGNAFGFRLSTSQTPTHSTKHWSLERCGDSGGFATVMDDGYGVSYMFIGEERSSLSIHSKRSDPETDSEKFGLTLLKTMDDMKNMFSL